MYVLGFIGHLTVAFAGCHCRLLLLYEHVRSGLYVSTQHIHHQTAVRFSTGEAKLRPVLLEGPVT